MMNWIRKRVGLKEKPDVVAVRRDRYRNDWIVTGWFHRRVLSRFSFGLMEDVTFRHKATDMACVVMIPSTGEAIGILNSQISKMPDDAIYTSVVSYDMRRRTFHKKDKPDFSVDWADYLLLRADGTSVAGWKRSSFDFET